MTLIVKPKEFIYIGTQKKRVGWRIKFFEKIIK